MFERFKFGSYRINENSELANSKKIKANKTFCVLVKFLDNTNVKFGIDVSKLPLVSFHEFTALTHPYIRKKPKAVIYWKKFSLIWISPSAIISA